MMSRTFLIREYLEQQLDVRPDKSKTYAITLSKLIDNKRDVAIFILEQLLGVKPDKSFMAIQALSLLTSCTPLKPAADTSLMQPTDFADVKSNDSDIQACIRKSSILTLEEQLSICSDDPEATGELQVGGEVSNNKINNADGETEENETVEKDKEAENVENAKVNEEEEDDDDVITVSSGSVEVIATIPPAKPDEFEDDDYKSEKESNTSEDSNISEESSVNEEEDEEEEKDEEEIETDETKITDTHARGIVKGLKEGGPIPQPFPNEMEILKSLTKGDTETKGSSDVIGGTGEVKGGERSFSSIRKEIVIEEKEKKSEKEKENKEEVEENKEEVEEDEKALSGVDETEMVLEPPDDAETNCGESQEKIGGSCGVEGQGNDLMACDDSTTMIASVVMDPSIVEQIVKMVTSTDDNADKTSIIRESEEVIDLSESPQKNDVMSIEIVGVELFDSSQQVLDGPSNDEGPGSSQDKEKEEREIIKGTVTNDQDTKNTGENGNVQEDLSGDQDGNADGEIVLTGEHILCPYCFLTIFGLANRMEHLMKCKMLPEKSEIRTREVEAKFKLMFIECPTHKCLTWIPPFTPLRKCVLCEKYIIWDVECFTRHLEMDHSPFPRLYISPELHEKLITIVSHIDYLENMEQNPEDETSQTVSRIEEKYRIVKELDLDQKIQTRARKRDSQNSEPLHTGLKRSKRLLTGKVDGNPVNELDTSTPDKDELKSQADNTNKEYDRLLKEHEKLQKQLSIAGGDKKDD